MIPCTECEHQHHSETIDRHGGCPNKPKLWECPLCTERHLTSTKICLYWQRVNIRALRTSRDGTEWAAIYHRYKGLIEEHVGTDGITLVDLYKTIRVILGFGTTMSLTLNDLVNGPLWRMKYCVKKIGPSWFNLMIYKAGDERGVPIGYATT